MDILIIDEKTKNNFFLRSIIEKYKKILSKPILRSEENKREKSDLVKEYIDIVNHEIKNNYFQKKDEILKEHREKVKLKQKKLLLPTPKIETLKEYYEIVKKMKKAAKTKKPILISFENEDKIFKESLEKNKLNLIDVDKILYYESDKKICSRCKNCNGINNKKSYDSFYNMCEDCYMLTEKVNFTSCHIDKGRVTYRKINKKVL